MKVTMSTILRTIVLLLVILNQVLTSIGKNPLPWSEEEMYQGLSAAATAVAALIAWWKNNSFTKEARAADQYMKSLKSGENNEDSETSDT